MNPFKFIDRHILKDRFIETGNIIFQIFSIFFFFTIAVVIVFFSVIIGIKISVLIIDVFSYLKSLII